MLPSSLPLVRIPLLAVELSTLPCLVSQTLTSARPTWITVISLAPMPPNQPWIPVMTRAWSGIASVHPTRLRSLLMALSLLHSRLVTRTLMNASPSVTRISSRLLQTTPPLSTLLPALLTVTRISSVALRTRQKPSERKAPATRLQTRTTRAEKMQTARLLTVLLLSCLWLVLVSFGCYENDEFK